MKKEDLVKDVRAIIDEGQVLGGSGPSEYVAVKMSLADEFFTAA